MPIEKSILFAAAIVLLVLAAVLEWPRTNPPGTGWGHPLGWLGLAAFVATFLVP